MWSSTSNFEQHFARLEELSTQQCTSKGNLVFFGALGVPFCRSLDSLCELLGPYEFGGPAILELLQPPQLQSLRFGVFTGCP